MGESKFSLWFSGGVTIVEVVYEVVYNALKFKKNAVNGPVVVQWWPLATFCHP